MDAENKNPKEGEQQTPSKSEILNELVELKVIDSVDNWDNLKISQLQVLKEISGKKVDEAAPAAEPQPEEPKEDLTEKHQKEIEELKTQHEEQLGKEIVKRRTAEQNLAAFKKQVQDSAKKLLDSFK